MAKEAHEFKEKAKRCYDSGDKAGAHAASVKGKELMAASDRLHQAAAETIFQYRNGKKPKTYIDLHGLFVDEALRYLTKRMDSLKKGDLEVVTGAGHHSENHVAKIKPAVIKLFQDRHLRFEPINAGDLKVHLG